ncbi:hypothetical protein [Rhodopirellula bahusiensis]|uniref:Uncharacterized protein n=1 Tax=Rhodopirellula bahusiensis TaxID=2014065 RepID=A0A2G1W837_9BACT|nr:hypothetical protein [Rhodopirellula bahusiensis]PHQ35183.1 hypothetical protein CEE69_12290 [Rhodopirellula bahusiensis]
MSNAIPRPRAYFFRDGVELTAHPANGRPVDCMGTPCGMTGKAVCFDSITVINGLCKSYTERDFKGPVSVKIWSPESKAIWFGIADAATVARLNAEAKA